MHVQYEFAKQKIANIWFRLGAVNEGISDIYL